MIKTKLYVVLISIYIGLAYSINASSRSRVGSPTKEKEIHVTATRYNPVAKECGKDPLVTADGSKINLKALKKKKIRWIAVSRDLLKVYKYGEMVKISGADELDGIYTIHDTMHKRWRKKVDILTHSSHKIKGGLWKVKIKKVSG